MTARTFLLAFLAACAPTPDQPTHDAPHPDAPRPDAPIPDAPVLDSAPVDAGPALACLGHAASTTAADPVAVTGKVFAIDHYQVSATAGTGIALHARSNDATIATASSAADGSFAMAVESHGAPVDGYFTVTAAGALPSRIDPGTPLLGGESELLVVAADAEVARWYADAGAPYVANSGALVTVAVDCDTQPVRGATLVSSPGNPIYYDDDAPRWDPSLTASTNGYALVVGASATTAVTASIGATQLPARTVTAPSGTLTVALLPPTTPD